MVAGTGIDIIEVARIADAARKWEDSFLSLVFTQYELEHAEDNAAKFQYLAVRFAAKEAVYKALGGAYGMGISWTDIEIHNEPSGKPTVRLYGTMKEMQVRQGIDKLEISLSHTGTHACASAIAIHEN